MAQVLTIPRPTPFPTIEPRPAPPEDLQRIPTTPREFGAQIGAAEETLGAGAVRTGEVFGRIAADEQANHVLTGINDLNMQLRALEGKDRMEAYPRIRKQMDDLLAQGRGNLTTATQIIDFDQQTRYLHARALREAGDLYDQAQVTWGKATNGARANIATLGISNSALAGDFPAVEMHTQELIGARMKDAELAGLATTPEVRANVERQARQDAIYAQVRALEPINAKLASKIFNDNRPLLSGTPAEVALSNSLAAHTRRQAVTELVTGALGAGGGVMIQPQKGPAAPVEPARIADFWKSKGFTEAQTQGILRNIQRESGFDAANVGDNGTSFGLYQHHAERLQNLQGFSPNWHDPLVQSEFAWRELNTTEQPALQALKTANTPAQAEEAFRRGFERPAGTVPAKQAAVDLGMQGGLVPSGAITPAYRSAGLTAALDHIARSDAEPDEKLLAANQVETKFRAQWAEEDRYETAWRRAQTEVSDKRETEIIANPNIAMAEIIGTPESGGDKLPNGQPNPLTPAARLRMVNFINKESKPEALTAVSHRTSMQLLEDIRRPAGDSQRITDRGPILDAYGADKLTRADRDDLFKQMEDIRSPEGEKLATLRKEFLSRMAPLITKSNPLMGSNDPIGDPNLYMYDWTIGQKIDEFRKAGKNPFDLFNPKSADYVGTADFVRPFQGTFQQSLKAKVGAIEAPPAAPAYPAAPAVVPRLPGETYPDWLKRTGSAMAPIPPASAAPGPVAAPAALTPPIARP